MSLRALGLHELWHFRAVSIAFAGIALLLWWAIVRSVTKSNCIALLACFFYSFSASFTEYSDSLHQHTVMQLTFMGCLVSWLAYESAATPARRRIWLTVACVLFFVDLWISFEHILFIPGVIALRTVIVGFRQKWLGALLVGSLPLLVIGLRLGHNALALGGINAAMSDLFGSAKYRSDGDGQAITAAKVANAWWQRLGAKEEGSDEYDPAMSFPVFRPRTAITIAALFILLIAAWDRSELYNVRRAFGFAILLLACGSLWFIAMRGHALVHRHVVMLLVPGLSLLVASLTAFGFWQWSNFPKKAPVRFLGPALSSLLIVWFVRDIRHSRAGTLLFQTNTTIAAQLAESRRAGEMRSLAGKSTLANVERIYFVGDMYPVFPYQVGRPFLFKNDLPDALAQNEAVWIEYWTPQERAAAEKALSRFGPPDVFSFSSSSLVFQQKNVTETVTTDITYDLGIKLVQMRFAETLDQQSWVAQTILEVPPAVRLDMLIGVVLVQDSEGKPKKLFDYALSSAMPRGARTVVSQIIPKKVVDAQAIFRFAFWYSSENRELKPVDPANAKLPQNSIWDEAKTGILWRPRLEQFNRPDTRSSP